MLGSGSVSEKQSQACSESSMVHLFATHLLVDEGLTSVDAAHLCTERLAQSQGSPLAAAGPWLHVAQALYCHMM